jgi:hypothetical protein
MCVAAIAGPEVRVIAVPAACAGEATIAINGKAKSDEVAMMRMVFVFFI